MLTWLLLDAGSSGDDSSVFDEDNTSSLELHPHITSRPIVPPHAITPQSRLSGLGQPLQPAHPQTALKTQGMNPIHGIAASLYLNDVSV